MEHLLLYPKFGTQRLILDQLTIDDTDSVFELFSSQAVVEYYDLEVFTDRAKARQLIEIFNQRYQDKLGIRWAIRLKQNNQLIGTCGFNSWSTQMKNAVIGYDLLPAYWRKGFTTEAVGRIITGAFTGELPCGELNRIQADTVPGNIASERLLVNLGFKQEGIRRQSGYWKNQFHDLTCFGLIRSDYTGT